MGRASNQQTVLYPAEDSPKQPRNPGQAFSPGFRALSSFLINGCSNSNSGHLAQTYQQSSLDTHTGYSTRYSKWPYLVIFGHIWPYWPFWRAFPLYLLSENHFFQTRFSLPILNHTKINSHLNENSKKYFFTTP